VSDLVSERTLGCASVFVCVALPLLAHAFTHSLTHSLTSTHDGVLWWWCDQFASSRGQRATGNDVEEVGVVVVVVVGDDSKRNPVLGSCLVGRSSEVGCMRRRTSRRRR